MPPDQHPDVILVTHALAAHKITLMRERDSGSYRFRRLMRQTALLLCAEMTKDLELRDRAVTCVTGETFDGKTRDQRDIVIVPILRAGLTLAEAFAELLPRARMGHMGIFNSDENNEPQCYMLSVPKLEDTSYFVLDPTIVQGKTMGMAVDFLLNAQIPPERIRVGAIMASEEGLQEFYGPADSPKRTGVKTYAFYVDEKIEHPTDSPSPYLKHGFGNVGNRLFSTFEDFEYSE